MQKIKLTKGELKRQRDALSQYRRYLPTLLLKKQQLQIEILRQLSILKDKKQTEGKQTETIKVWAGLLAEGTIDIRPWIRPRAVKSSLRNIAGVDFPVVGDIEFILAEYDLYSAPLWVDTAIERFRQIASIREEIAILEKGIDILRHELRITTQRVNLFEKVKIPESEEAIRLIKIYIGDQMANAVGRSKMAKKKIEEEFLQGAAL